MVTYDDVLDAARRIEGVAHRTPVVTSRTLDREAGGEVFLKCESFQRVGAFKFRGAYNALSRIDRESEERRAREAGADGWDGVLAFSSGNHAQGVALAGSLLDLPTTIVMPEDAPRPKRAATEGYGARVVPYDPAKTKREELAAELLREGAYTLIPPFDHPHVIAGQGTAALELLEEIPALDAILAPCGGGGLLSGTAVAASVRAPGCRVVGIEPETADDAARSFRSGELQRVENPRTIADGTRTSSLGEITFPLIREHVSAFETVSEDAIREAVRFLFHRLKLVVEPSGALGVAALLSGAARFPGRRVGVILSGGNVDGAVMAEILGEGADP